MLSSALRRALPALLVCLASLMMWPAVQDVVRDWSGDFSSLSHGPLLFALVIWLVWRQGPLPAHVQARYCVPAALLVLLCGAVATIGRLSTLQPLSGLAWPPALLFALVGLYGMEGLRRFAVPTLMLYFAMPVWAPLEFGVLWPATVAIAPRIVAALGIPLRTDAEFVHMPSGTFEIEPGCSGANFVLVGLLLSALIAHLWRVPPHRAVAIVVGGGVLAFLANLVRVVVIMLLGHFTQMQHPWVEDHMFLGWWIFAIAFALSFWRLQRRLGQGRDPDPVPAAGNSRPPAIAMLSLLVAAGAVPLSSAAALRSGAAEPGERARQVAVAIAAAPVGAFPEGGPLSPVFPGADVERRYVANPEGAVEVYFNAYLEQHRGKELLSDETRLLHPLATVVEAEHSVALGDDVAARVGETFVRTPDGALWMVRDAFYAGTSLADTEGAAKRALLLAVLRRGPVVSGVVVTAVRCEDAACDSGRSASDAVWRRIAGALRSR